MSVLKVKLVIHPNLIVRLSESYYYYFYYYCSVTLRGPPPGSHGLSARRARRTKSRGPKGLQLEVGARKAPRLLVLL